MEDIDTLFRLEVLEQRRDAWFSNVSYAAPPAFSFFAIGAVVIVAAFLIFICSTSYTKKARVSGYIIPEHGWIKIFPQSAGKVEELYVKEGQYVHKGDPIAKIDTEHVTSGGATQHEVIKTIKDRIHQLETHKQITHSLYQSNEESLNKRIAQVTFEREKIRESIIIQNEKFKIAKKIADQGETLFNLNAASELEYRQKKVALLEEQNKQIDLNRLAATSDKELASLKNDRLSNRLKERDEFYIIGKNLSELEESLSLAVARSEEILLASADGTISALQLNIGKQVSTNQPALNLIPLSDNMVAELYVPTRAAGFVKLGARVELQYQAFPYQKFGTQTGSVTSIAHAALISQELATPINSSDSFFVVRVSLARQFIGVYGQHKSLQAGMQLDADIWLEKRTLIEWIFEPLISIAKKI